MSEPTGERIPKNSIQQKVATIKNWLNGTTPKDIQQMNRFALGAITEDDIEAHRAMNKLRLGGTSSLLGEALPNQTAIDAERQRSAEDIRKEIKEQAKEGLANLKQTPKR